MAQRILFSESEIQIRTAQLAERINQDYGNENTLVVLIVLHGAFLFAADLIRKLAMPTYLETTRVRSYQGTQSTGKMELLIPIPPVVTGKNVLVVEDIVDSGRTLEFLLPKIWEAGALSVKVATLLDKPEAHGSEVRADYVGFQIGQNFVIGYGLDLDGKYRNLPHIAELLLNDLS